MRLRDLAARWLPWLAPYTRRPRHSHPPPSITDTVVLYPRDLGRMVPISPGRRPETLADIPDPDATRIIPPVDPDATRFIHIPAPDADATQIIPATTVDAAAVFRLPTKIDPLTGDTMLLPWPTNPQPPRWRP